MRTSPTLTWLILRVLIPRRLTIRPLISKLLSPIPLVRLYLLSSLNPSVAFGITETSVAEIPEQAIHDDDSYKFALFLTTVLSRSSTFLTNPDSSSFPSSNPLDINFPSFQPTAAYSNITELFILYVDESKEKRYGAALHQIKPDVFKDWYSNARFTSLLNAISVCLLC